MTQGPRCACLVLLGLGLLAQAPPPMPRPKPLTVPAPGALRPKDTAPPASSTAVGSSPASAPRQEATWGATPAPWPNGSSDPKDFPAEFPRVQGARVEAYSMAGTSAMAFYECETAPRAVAERYREFVAREGWEIVPFPGPPLPRDAVFMARKGDWSLRVDASVNPLTGFTEAFVMVSLKPLPPPPRKEKAKPQGTEEP